MIDTMSASSELQGGMVSINAPLPDNDAGPFVGTRMRGMDRQPGPEGLETFRQARSVRVDPFCGAQECWRFPSQDDEAYPGAAG